MFSPLLVVFLATEDNDLPSARGSLAGIEFTGSHRVCEAMVFYLSQVQGPRLGRWRPGEWSRWARRWHRARERWHFGSEEDAKRCKERVLATMHRLTDDTAYTFAGALQMVSVVRVIASADTIEATATSASPVPAFVPFGVLFAAILWWLPFPDFGMNHRILHRFHDAPQRIDIHETGAWAHLLDVISPHSAFFIVFHLLPVTAGLCVVLASGITDPPLVPPPPR